MNSFFISGLYFVCSVGACFLVGILGEAIISCLSLSSLFLLFLVSYQPWDKRNDIIRIAHVFNILVSCTLVVCLTCLIYWPSNLLPTYLQSTCLLRNIPMTLSSVFLRAHGAAAAQYRSALSRPSLSLGLLDYMIFWSCLFSAVPAFCPRSAGM